MRCVCPTWCTTDHDKTYCEPGDHTGELATFDRGTVDLFLSGGKTLEVIPRLFLGRVLLTEWRLGLNHRRPRVLVPGLAGLQCYEDNEHRQPGRATRTDVRLVALRTFADWR